MFARSDRTLIASFDKGLLISLILSTSDSCECSGVTCIVGLLDCSPTLGSSWGWDHASSLSGSGGVESSCGKGELVSWMEELGFGDWSSSIVSISILGISLSW